MPGMSYLVPWFILFSALQMIGSHLAVILSHLTVTMPLIIWILIGFFEDLPRELFDAARIDGCSIYSAFCRVALPLALPGVIVSGILSFIFSWNNFMLSLILGGSGVRTLPVAVYNFIGDTQIDWGGLNATATTVTLPVVFFVLIVQRHVVKGLTLGAVKG
jgi:multiple sugar transport system permease protein